MYLPHCMHCDDMIPSVCCDSGWYVCGGVDGQVLHIISAAAGRTAGNDCHYVDLW